MAMTECDLWTGNTNPDGYGRLHIAVVDGKRYKMSAHRLMWQQTFGHTDLQVLHSCDTPNCINIDHLRTGTIQDNMRDREERGRQWNQAKTHCRRGHELIPENIYASALAARGQRICKACRRISSAALYYRNKERSLTQ